jgi:tetraacyldisaccharide 4'-kinase
LGLLSVFYSVGLRCRKFMVKPKRLPSKVISVGNLTLGGTGKTPAVIAISEEAKKRGLQPCILTRGYRGKSKGPCFVKSKGKQADNGKLICADAGDEPALMAERLKDVPIIKCRDRYRGGLFALDNLKSELRKGVLRYAPTANLSFVFILDDGFQHWSLHRDIDILLIDATNPFGDEKLFPEGGLREPLSAIKRANIIALTKTDVVNKKIIASIIQKINKYNPEAPVYTSSHRAAAIVNASGESMSIDALKNKKVHAFAGIANPDYFRDVLISNGAEIARFKSFRDHHVYKQRDIDKIKSEAAGLDIITTEKDLVKLKELRLPDNMFALRIEFSIDDAFYDKLFNALHK